MLYWVDTMTSSVISFAYFAHFSNLNISGTNEDIYKQQTAFFIFPGILCDKLKKSRAKNLIIAALYIDEEFFLICRHVSKLQTSGIEIRENRLMGDFFRGQITITSPHSPNTPTPPHQTSNHIVTFEELNFRH